MISSERSLAGKRALVTGAVRGLGRAIADAIVQRGGIVHGTSRDASACADINDRYGTRTPVLDVRDPDAIDTVVDFIVAASGPLDLLVNNAGINITGAAIDVAAKDWDAVHETNVRGAFLVSRACARHWLALGKPASIVNVASQAGIVAIEERVAYGTSKAALIQLTRALALEWAEAGIRVNSVAPTFVATELTASTLARPEFAATLLGRLPIGRFGEPAEVATAVAFLLSDDASLITGHTLVADGGYTIR